MIRLVVVIVTKQRIVRLKARKIALDRIQLRKVLMIITRNIYGKTSLINNVRPNVGILKIINL